MGKLKRKRNRKSSSLQFINPLKCCLFCNKKLEEENITNRQDEVERFWTLLERHLEAKLELLDKKEGALLFGGELLEKTESDGALMPCEDCFKIVHSFCDLYTKIKCLEMQANSMVMRLESALVSADKECEDGGQRQFKKNLSKEKKMNGFGEQVANFRKQLITKCKHKLLHTFPRICVERCDTKKTAKNRVDDHCSRSELSTALTPMILWDDSGEINGEVTDFVTKKPTGNVSLSEDSSSSNPEIPINCTNIRNYFSTPYAASSSSAQIYDIARQDPDRAMSCISEFSSLSQHCFYNDDKHRDSHSMDLEDYQYDVCDRTSNDDYQYSPSSTMTLGNDEVLQHISSPFSMMNSNFASSENDNLSSQQLDGTPFENAELMPLSFETNGIYDLDIWLDRLDLPENFADLDANQHSFRTGSPTVEDSFIAFPVHVQSNTTKEDSSVDACPVPVVPDQKLGHLEAGTTDKDGVQQSPPLVNSISDGNGEQSSREELPPQPPSTTPRRSSRTVHLCDDCGIRFASQENLKLHKKSYHSPVTTDKKKGNKISHNNENGLEYDSLEELEIESNSSLHNQYPGDSSSEAMLVRNLTSRRLESNFSPFSDSIGNHGDATSGADESSIGTLSSGESQNYSLEGNNLIQSSLFHLSDFPSISLNPSLGIAAESGVEEYILLVPTSGSTLESGNEIALPSVASLSFLQQVAAKQLVEEPRITIQRSTYCPFNTEPETAVQNNRPKVIKRSIDLSNFSRTRKSKRISSHIPKKLCRQKKIQNSLRCSISPKIKHGNHSKMKSVSSSCIAKVIDSKISAKPKPGVTHFKPNKSHNFRNKLRQSPVKKKRCSKCGKLFRDNYLLQIHFYTHLEPESWPFACGVCGKKCRSRQRLASHERSHTNEKPFACHLCDARYTQRHNLKNHLSSKHRTGVEEQAKKVANRYKMLRKPKKED